MYLADRKINKNKKWYDKECQEKERKRVVSKCYRAMYDLRELRKSVKQKKECLNRMEEYRKRRDVQQFYREVVYQRRGFQPTSILHRQQSVSDCKQRRGNTEIGRVFWGIIKYVWLNNKCIYI